VCSASLKQRNITGEESMVAPPIFVALPAYVQSRVLVHGFILGAIAPCPLAVYLHFGNARLGHQYSNIPRV